MEGRNKERGKEKKKKRELPSEVAGVLDWLECRLLVMILIKNNNNNKKRMYKNEGRDLREVVVEPSSGSRSALAVTDSISIDPDETPERMDF